MSALKLLFTGSGRINRVQYLIGNVYLIGSYLIIYMIMGLLFGSTTDVQPEDVSTGVVAAAGLLGILMFLLLPFYMWGLFAVTIKRFHDINVTGWASLLLLIPIVGNVVWLVLFFIPGTEGKNRFGESMKDPAAPQEEKPSE